MAIVLSMIEDDFIDRDLSLDSPVLAYRQVSRDLDLPRDRSGSRTAARMTAVDLQREFLELAHRYYRDRGARAVGRATCWRAGSSVLDRLAAGPHDARPRARLGHQAPAHRELHGQARSGLDRLAGGDDRPPVPRHPAGQGPLLQARGVRRGRADRDRRRDRQGHLRPAQGHARLLPGDVPAAVLRGDRLGVAGTR